MSSRCYSVGGLVARSARRTVLLFLGTVAFCVLGLVTPALTQQAPTGEAGRQLFFAQGCYGCHRIGAAGTPIAHDLSHVGRKYSASELAKWLRDPASQKPNAHMPRLALTENEIQELTAYLASLR